MISYSNVISVSSFNGWIIVKDDLDRLILNPPNSLRFENNFNPIPFKSKLR